MNNTLCPHCQQTDNNKLLLINGTVGSKNKLIIECETELGKLTKEFVTTAEIRYCPVCGKKLSTIESESNKKDTNENECEYCIDDDDTIRLCNKGKSMLDPDIPKDQVVFMCGGISGEGNAFIIRSEAEVTPSCMLEIRMYLDIDYCPICGKELTKRKHRIFEEHQDQDDDLFPFYGL